MAYTKTNWVNGTTPLNDKNMNKIENELENLDTNISKSTDEYSSTRTYSIGELVIYNNKLYKANQDITTAEAFNSSHWTEATLLSDVNEIKAVVNNNADNLNKIEDELAKSDPTTPYTTATGTYITAEWSLGTNNCVWTAPKTGLYIIFSRFGLEDDSNAQIYKQLQLKGTATRISGNMLLYQWGPSTATSREQGIAMFSGATLVYANQGETITPYIHTPKAGIIWNIEFVGLFLK